MNIGTLALPAFAIAALSACGGSGTGSGLTYGTDITLPAGGGAGSGFLESSELETIGAANEALREAIFDEGRYATTSGNGVSNMTGYIGLSEDGVDDESIVGNMSLTVDFDMADVTGTVADMAVFDESGDTPTRIVDLTGTLNLLGAINGSGFAADVTGDLSDGTETYSIDVDLGGNLYDVDGVNTLVGGATGLYTLNGADTALDGEFLAQ